MLSLDLVQPDCICRSLPIGSLQQAMDDLDVRASKHGRMELAGGLVTYENPLAKGAQFGDSIEDHLKGMGPT